MTEDPGQGNRQVSHAGAQGSRFSAKLIALLVCLALCFTGFIALGSWQVQRLAWKEELISRVERRIHAAAVDAPRAAQWTAVNAESDEYRHVHIAGSFLHELATKVQATTSLGSGFWLLTPLRTAEGGIVLINRGFIPQQGKGAAQDFSGTDAGAAAQDDVSVVTGLLRMSEPGGGFLRKNDAAQARWYSRDVQAIAAARGLTLVAPYFIDADALEESVYDHASDGHKVRYPVGGLTVVSFPNNHLVYALTWFALAVMTAGAAVWALREEFGLSHADEGS